MITFCLGFRNWHDAHLRRCLASLHRFGKPVVVATDSTAVASICERYGAKAVVREMGEWSRSYSLNEAAAQATTPYVCFTDADMVFPSSWLRAAQAAMAPHKMLLTDSRDLDVEHTCMLDQVECDGFEFDLWLRVNSAYHDRVGQGAGMVLPLEWFKNIGGFDEYYKVWGCEDNDLVKRALLTGLEVRWLPGTFVVHQWHRRDWPTKEQYEQVDRNRRYFAVQTTLVRNGGPQRWA